MGYCASMSRNSFHVKTEYTGRVLKKLENCGYIAELDDDGNIFDLDFSGDKIAYDEDTMFQAIAPYIEVSSKWSVKTVTVGAGFSRTVSAKRSGQKLHGLTNRGFIKHKMLLCRVFLFMKGDYNFMKNNDMENELTKWRIKNGKLYSKDSGFIDDPSVLIRVDTGQLLFVGNYDSLQALSKWAGAINGWNMCVKRIIEKTPAETLAHIQQLAKVRWYIHSVFQTQELPEYIQNNHTHGLQEEYDHYDFQLLINLGENEISRLLNTIAFRVQEGEQFNSGQMVSGLYEDCDIRLDLFRETGRDVLRLIIPDKDNRFPEDPLCSTPYKYQTQRLFE